MGTTNWPVTCISQLVGSEIPEYSKNGILVESGQHALAYLIKGKKKVLVKASQLR